MYYKKIKKKQRKYASSFLFNKLYWFFFGQFYYGKQITSLVNKCDATLQDENFIIDQLTKLEQTETAYEAVLTARNYLEILLTLIYFGNWRQKYRAKHVLDILCRNWHEKILLLDNMHPHAINFSVCADIKKIYQIIDNCCAKTLTKDISKNFKKYRKASRKSHYQSDLIPENYTEIYNKKGLKKDFIRMGYGILLATYITGSILSFIFLPSKLIEFSAFIAINIVSVTGLWVLSRLTRDSIGAHKAAIQNKRLNKHNQRFKHTQNLHELVSMALNLSRSIDLLYKKNIHRKKRTGKLLAVIHNLDKKFQQLNHKTPRISDEESLTLLGKIIEIHRIADHRLGKVKISGEFLKRKERYFQLNELLVLIKYAQKLETNIKLASSKEKPKYTEELVGYLIQTKKAFADKYLEENENLTPLEQHFFSVLKQSWHKIIDNTSVLSIKLRLNNFIQPLQNCRIPLVQARPPQAPRLFPGIFSTPPASPNNNIDLAPTVIPLGESNMLRV